MSTNLELFVAATNEFELTVTPLPDPVSSAVHHRIRSL